MIKVFKKNVLWVIIIFLLSSFFRLSNLDLIEFKSDEATIVNQTIKFFEHPYLIERGLISGTGVYNFPLFNYVMVVLSLWSRDPLFLSGIISLLNSFLVVLFFLMVRRFYGLLPAIFSSVLLAVSAWGVLFSRKIWAQDLINLFLIPFLYLLHEFILKKNVKALLPLFILLTLLIQLHGSGLFLAAATILILLTNRSRLNITKALTGFFLGSIPMIPYLLYQINSSPFCPDCQAFIKYSQSIRNFDFNVFLRPFQIISGLGYYFVLGADYPNFMNTFPVIYYLKYIFASSFLPILLSLILIIHKQKKYFFLVIYFITTPFLFLITKTPAYMHYFVIIIPISLLLFAIFVSTLYSSVRSKFIKTLVISYFLMFVVATFTFTSLFYRYVATKIYIAGDYGTVYFYSQKYLELQK